MQSIEFLEIHEITGIKKRRPRLHPNGYSGSRSSNRQVKASVVPMCPALFSFPVRALHTKNTSEKR